MNILMHTIASPFNGEQVGGAETSLRLIAEKLTQKGHKVIFICKSNKKTFLGIEREINKGVIVYTLTDIKLPFSNRYRIKIIINYLQKLFIQFIIKNQNIDTVYTYYNLDICLFYLNLKQLNNYSYSLIIRIAGMRWYEMIKKNSNLAQGYKYIFEQSDALNFISEGLFVLFKDSLKEMKLDLQINNYFIKDIGVEISDKSLIQENNIFDKLCFNIVMVSRFTDYQKRQDLLIQAFSLIKEKKDFKLYLIGEGPLKSKHEKMIASLGLENQVYILPFIPQQELWSLLTSANLLCHACNYEGLSKIIIESMFREVPVMVSDVLPLNKYITDGENGYLVANNPISWANKILEAYANQSNLSFISKNAKNYVMDNYNADRNIEVYIDNFLKLNNKNLLK